MRTALLGMVLSMLLVGVAYADPTYLDCTLGSEADTGIVHLDVTLNEASATAAYVVRETGFSQRSIPAIFTARDVTFRTVRSYGASDLYRIDRVSLEFTNDIGSVDGTVLVRRSGVCEIAPVPERAF